MALALAEILRVGEAPIWLTFSEIMADLSFAGGYFSFLSSDENFSWRYFLRSTPVRDLTTSGIWARTSATWAVILVVPRLLSPPPMTTILSTLDNGSGTAPARSGRGLGSISSTAARVYFSP